MFIHLLNTYRPQDFPPLQQKILMGAEIAVLTIIAAGCGLALFYAGTNILPSCVGACSTFAVGVMISALLMHYKNKEIKKDQEPNQALPPKNKSAESENLFNKLHRTYTPPQGPVEFINVQ